MRAAIMTGVIASVLALGLVLVAVFYWLAGFLGVATAAMFGGDWYFVGTAIANIITLVLVVVMVIASLLTMAERKWSSMMQDRIGPNRARLAIIPGLKNRALGGIPHFLADGLKMVTKEDTIPAQASRGLFALAPMLAFGAVFVLFVVIPVAPPVVASEIPGIASIASSWGVQATFPVALHVAPDLDIGVLYLFALSSIAVYGTALAGWASNNKLALLGGVRGSSQMIAYEVALGLSLVGCMMAYGSLQLDEMTNAQSVGIFGGALPAWGFFLQPIGFLLFFTASLAETKRSPFDAPEGESEVVGYFVEYSGMRFGMFMISEFVEIVVLAGILVAIFLGGYHLPLPPAWGAEEWIRNAWGPFALAVLMGFSFLIKLAVLIWLQMMIRWTYLRFRFDQIQTLGWKILLPLALTNLFVTGVLILLDQSLDLLAIVGIAELLVIIGITALYPSQKPASIRYSGQGLTRQAAATQGHGH